MNEAFFKGFEKRASLETLETYDRNSDTLSLEGLGLPLAIGPAALLASGLSSIPEAFAARQRAKARPGKEDSAAYLGRQQGSGIISGGLLGALGGGYLGNQYGGIPGALAGALGGIGLGSYGGYNLGDYIGRSVLGHDNVANIYKGDKNLKIS